MTLSGDIRDIAMHIDMALAGTKQPGPNHDVVALLNGAAVEFEALCPYCYQAAQQIAELASLYFSETGAGLSKECYERLRFDMLSHLHRIRIRAGYWQSRGA
jgi:hypothetical protein